MSDVISSIFDQETLGAQPFFNGGAFNNHIFREGEVVDLIPPNSDRSVSKLFNEYNVMVPHYEHGIIGHKLYHNCRLINSLAGGGDHSTFTLRPSTVDITKGSRNGDGSRVVLLCIEGSYNRAVILGGLLDARCGGDDPKAGHHFVWEFNGVQVKVNDDGGWEIVTKGKTTNLGKVDPKADKSGIGTTVKVQADGSFIISSPKGQSIVIDNKKDTITITGHKDVTIDGDKIHLGEGARQQAVLGNELASILRDLISTLATSTHWTVGTPGTMTSPPLNAGAILAIAGRLDSMLSRRTYVDKG